MIQKTLCPMNRPPKVPPLPMKRFLPGWLAVPWLLAVLPVDHATAAVAEPSPPTAVASGHGRFETTLQRPVSFRYLQFLPQGYGTDPQKKWPLMVFLHGAGERGTDLEKVAVHGPPKLAAQRPEFPFVVISPQCPENQLWDVEALDALLTHVLATLTVDPARVYLTGLSMGGNGTWSWATAHPDRFAAIVPICGWADPVQVWISSGPRRPALERLPIWAFHGAKDEVVPLSNSQAMVKAFERIGNHARLTVDPDAGHDSWTAAYNDPALYDWLLRQRRP